MKRFIALFFLMPTVMLHAQQYTRGVGVYPGDPKQYDGPALVVDSSSYRNLALHRPAYQSSAYDYNLTAQLVTDGIKEHALPIWIATSTSDRGLLPKNEREMILDGNPVSSIRVAGDNPWVEVSISGGNTVPEIDHVDVWLRKINTPPPSGGWSILISGSNDGASWKEVGRRVASEFRGESESDPASKEAVRFAEPVSFRTYRVEFSGAGVRTWNVADLTFFDKENEIHFNGPDVFSSAWMSAGGGEEWVSVDLGAPCTFDRMVLSWLSRPAEGAIQVSEDGTNWRLLQSLPNSSANTDDMLLPSPEHARWVRALMKRPVLPEVHYILTEFEVFGRGGPVPKPKDSPVPQADGVLRLSGGNWRVQRASLVQADGGQLSQSGFDDRNWLVATVPGTVLTSYLNDGAIPNPNFGENQYAVSDAFFCADFWYRDKFSAPVAHATGQHFWLNFDGINWKAEIYLNGQHVGRMGGGFVRGRFDVTTLVHPGGPNALAVLILRNDHPGGTKDKAGDTVNGGALGRDNPTFHASSGWDWMPTVRGRNSGIWSNVTLTVSGAVMIEAPHVISTLPLPETSTADLAIHANLHNLETHTVTGTLNVNFGDIKLASPVTIDPTSSKTVELTPATFPSLHMSNPKLWWPNGYGDPSLYPVTMTFTVGDEVSDRTSFQAGIRQYTYSEEDGLLRIWINGRRFIARGGNWGFSESMLRYRAREYDIAMRFHREQHFNMVRDWVGQTGDEAFYDAADRNGIVIWQDFWLANPWDGQDPDDNALFLANARDYLLRIRNHPSLGLFCGRNEGFPPKPLDDGLRAMLAELEPTAHYISSSADGPVSGHGPYWVVPLKEYFAKAPSKMHSEIGSPNVPEGPIMNWTLSSSGMWPIDAQWHLHDFYPHNPFASQITKNYGGASNVAEFISLAQFVNYNAYRGMFESQGNHRLGLLIWMSHPSWPSILWQTYDYFYDTDAGYFAAKKASEPLHIQWNAAADTIEVVNYSAGNQSGLNAHAEVIDIYGKVKWEKSATVDSLEDTTISPFSMEYPAGLSNTHFIRLNLSRGDKVLSTNLYLHSTGEEDYTGIRALPPARVVARSSTRLAGSIWQIVTELRNKSTFPALMVRVKVIREKSGDLILPTFYDDNYIALMPGEVRTIQVELDNADTGGERPRVVVQGYNLAESTQR